MYFVFLPLLLLFAACHCSKNSDETNGSHCDRLRQWAESISVSVELSKQGFHREVITAVQFSPALLSGVRVLLLYQWPRGVYIDPYQLTSLMEQSDWQILLDSDVDLEVPAHKASGFVSYVFPLPDEPTPRRLNVAIPIHGRYHEPSAAGKTSTTVHIQAPELLLRDSTCLQHDNFEHHMVVDAPCTVDNSSTCSWLKIRQHQLSPMSLQIPVGDKSLVMPVCAGTLLVTVISCLLLSRYMWKYQIVQ